MYIVLVNKLIDHYCGYVTGQNWAYNITVIGWVWGLFVGSEDMIVDQDQRPRATFLPLCSTEGQVDASIISNINNISVPPRWNNINWLCSSSPL